MYLYVELWKARPVWLTLGKDERERFFGTVGQEIGNQIGAGCELVAVARNDADTPRPLRLPRRLAHPGPGARGCLRGGLGAGRLSHLLRADGSARRGGDPGRLRGCHDRAVAGAKSADACRAIRPCPSFSDFDVRHFDVLEDLSRLTGSPQLATA